MSGSFAFGTLGGLHIKFNASWLFIVPILVISLAVGWFPARVPGIVPANAWALGIAGALAYWLSMLLHEYAHVVAARSSGRREEGTTLYIFGSISPQEHLPSSPANEVLVALAGPLASLTVGVLCWIFADVVGAHAPQLAAFLLFVGLANVFVGLVNLIPTFPLDGGRALRGLLASIRGEPLSVPGWRLRLGEALYALCLLAGIAITITENGDTRVLGIWLLLVGLCLLLAAQAVDRQAALEAFFRDRTVRMAMNPRPAVVLASISLQQVVDEYFLPRGLRAVAVSQIGELVGLVTLRDVHEWPREQWATVPVAYVMVPRTRLHVAFPRERLEDALADLARFDVNQLPVVEGNTLVGMLSRDIVLGFLGRTHAARAEEPKVRHALRLPLAS